MWRQPYRRYSEEEIIAAARDFPALMGASGARFTERVLEALPQLRYISKFGVGVDNIDVDAATRRGVLIANTPEESEVIDVAEHTLAMILGLKKRLSHWTAQYMREGGWRPGVFAETLAGSTVGLIGLGQIGCAVAQRLAGWGVSIKGFDPYSQALIPGVDRTDLRSLLSDADIISLHASPSPASRHMIDRSAFDLMKPHAILINTARASLIDTNSLLEALASRRIAGAAIDVYDDEPPPTDGELFRQENVIVTPHTAAWTWRGLQNIGWHAARNLHAMFFGRSTADIVNRRGSPQENH
jgi:D-3-phosphoglycerate dehydrogenase